MLSHNLGLCTSFLRVYGNIFLNTLLYSTEEIKDGNKVLEWHGRVNYASVFICEWTIPLTKYCIKNHSINKWKGHAKLQSESDLTEISERRQILMPPWITSKCWLSVCLLCSGVRLECQIFIPLFCSASCKSITAFTYPEEVNHRVSSWPLNRLEG